MVPDFEDGFEKLCLAFEAAAVGGCQGGLQGEEDAGIRERTQERKAGDFRSLGYMKLAGIFNRGVGVGLVLAAFAATAQAGLLKASPAPPSPFLEHPQLMGRDPGRTPFDKVWRNPSPAAWERVSGFDRVVIMPVNITYVQVPPRRRAEVVKMAAFMQAQFQKEFAQGGFYRVVSHPGPKTLELQMALVELKPTNVPGNVVSTGASVVAPGANLVGQVFTHGTIAFEAKLRNGQTGGLLAEYADREFDKLSLFSFRDYDPYAHNRRAVMDWAKQMKALATMPVGEKVPGAMRLTLNPF